MRVEHKRGLRNGFADATLHYWIGRIRLQPYLRSGYECAQIPALSFIFDFHESLFS
jgi:hypothetical protein